MLYDYASLLQCANGIIETNYMTLIVISIKVILELLERMLRVKLSYIQNLNEDIITATQPLTPVYI